MSTSRPTTIRSVSYTHLDVYKRQVLVGHPTFTVTSGEVTYLGQDLLAMDAVERAHAGLFLSFQYPVELSLIHI